MDSRFKMNTLSASLSVDISGYKALAFDYSSS